MDRSAKSPRKTFVFTRPQLGSIVEQFLLAGGQLTTQDDTEPFLDFVDIDVEVAMEEGLYSSNKDQEFLTKYAHEPLKVTSSAPHPIVSSVSSVGKILSSKSSVARKKNNTIVPLIENLASTAFSVLNSPNAMMYMENKRRDNEFEEKKIDLMDNKIQSYTHEEDEMFTLAQGLLSSIKMKGAIQFKNYKKTFSQTLTFQGFYNLKEADIYIKATYKVRGNHSHVAARFTNYYSTCMNPAFGAMKEADDEATDFLEIPNDHSAIFCQAYSFPSPLSDREIICNIVWKRLNDRTIIATFYPLTSHEQVENKDDKDFIRGSFHGAYKFTQLDDGSTEVELGKHLNFGGHLPRVIVHGFVIPNFDRMISNHQVYFLNSLPLVDLTKDDGKMLGEIFVNQIKKARKRGGWKKRAELTKIGVDEFLYCSVAMRELLPRHPWFRALLLEISLNQVKVAPTVTTALSEIKDQDAINLAKGLSTIILSNTEAPTAVDHWFAQNVALEEFETEYLWTRSFFVEIAQYNLNTSNLGLRLRVFGGALLSTVDLITDVYMTVKFFNTEGQEGYGRINAWIIGLTMLTQIILSYVNHFKKPGYFFKDALAVLVGFKPALDAYRVGSGAEQGEHQLLNPLAEMSYCKVVEVVFEAVPSTIIQIYALLLADKRGLDALASILVSALTVGFTSSMISYDWDTSPSQRAKAPSFYGFVPDKALTRAICFFSMIAISFAQVLLLTFSCALLAMTNTKFLALFIGLDTGIFSLYKIIKKDFYQQYNLSGILRLTQACLTRLTTTKLMVNYTMMFQLRNPNEAGGFMFMFAVLYSIVGSFISAHLYSNYYEGTTKLSDESLKNVLVTFSVVWLVSAVSFVSVVKRNYLHTFYSFETTSEYKRRCFMSFREDQEDLKIKVLKDHPDVYKKWGDELIKPWTINNWNRWEEEKPAWFTDKWIDHVPNHYVPYDWRVKYKKTKGRAIDAKSQQQKRRRSIDQVKALLGGEEDR
ncbi:hypothetical protein TrST_g3882 [Triparma strigata]|uniref:Uncharacterized protein n=1 Tax=Triparma strigata TaxID=1606541 RepID=A0A9W7BR46_9STRA|nr:hypothetical protein TrST_g3882 [Triparma strigata]